MWLALKVSVTALPAVKDEPPTVPVTEFGGEGADEVEQATMTPLAAARVRSRREEAGTTIYILASAPPSGTLTLHDAGNASAGPFTVVTQEVRLRDALQAS
jgi:hypothetical protein